MERNDIKIGIDEILKDKPKGTKLYSKLIGDCTVGELAKIDAKITQLKEIATKYGGEKNHKQHHSAIRRIQKFSTE